MSPPHTARLTLLPVTRDLLLAAVADPALVGKRLGLDVAAGWPNEDERGIFPGLADDLASDPALTAWIMHLIVHTADRTIIGCGGPLGRPTPTGSVEVGYGIAPPYQGRGYATEATRAMVAWSLEQASVHRVTASCLRTNTASRRVIEKVGFRPLPPTDPYLNWEIRKGSWPPAG